MIPLQGPPVTLTLEVATRGSFVPNNILIQPQTTKLWPETNAGRTDRQRGNYNFCGGHNNPF